jgi:hypothetical protein
MTNAATWTIRLAESVEDRKARPAAAGSLARDDQTVVIAEWEIVRRAQGFDEDALQTLYETTTRRSIATPSFRWAMSTRPKTWHQTSCSR